MNSDRTIKPISISKLRAGDILLCYKDEKFDPAGMAITRATGSEYTHAAICIGSGNAAESTVSNGVTKTGLQSLVQRYDHVAIFRQPDAWRPAERIQALMTFIDSIIASKAKYNLRDVVTFRNRREVHELTLHDQLHAFFAGNLVPSPAEKGSYFCSELVADCFVASGFIDPSASILYKSDVTSPGALGRDPTFGTFYGYASNLPNYKIPVTDEFINSSTSMRYSALAHNP